MRNKNAISCVSSEDFAPEWINDCNVETSYYLYSLDMTYVKCGC